MSTKTKRKPPDKKQDEISLLVQDTIIGGYTVRQWSLGQIVELAPIWDRIFKRAKETGFQFDGDNISELLLLINPDVIEIIKITLRISDDETAAMPGEDGLAIILAIVNKNFSYLKNLFGPLIQLINILRGKASR